MCKDPVYIQTLGPIVFKSVGNVVIPAHELRD